MKKKKYIPSTFLEGKNINLIVLDEELINITNWYRWFNDKKTNTNTVYHVYPNTKELQINFFKKNIKNVKNKIQLGIYHIKDKKLIGVISLNNIDILARTKSKFLTLEIFW